MHPGRHFGCILECSGTLLGRYGDASGEHLAGIPERFGDIQAAFGVHPGGISDAFRKHPP